MQWRPPAQLDTDRQHAIYIDSVESGESLGYSATITTRRPLYCSSAGRVFLYYMSERARHAYFGSVRLGRLTENTETDRGRLERIRDTIRETGTAITMGTYSKDASGFCVPLVDAGGCGDQCADFPR
jgi:DNA-binding IclR family transcriptional regulator